MPDGPIRVIGEYELRLMLHSEIECQITVVVKDANASDE